MRLIALTGHTEGRGENLFGGHGLVLDALGYDEEIALVQVDVPLASVLLTHLDDQIALHDRAHCTHTRIAHAP